MRYFFIISFLISFSFAKANTENVTVMLPDIVVSSVPVELECSFSQKMDSVASELVFKINDEVLDVEWVGKKAILQASFDGESQFEVVVSDEVIFKKEIHPIPLWMSILPPLIAIIMALVTKEVFTSLFMGLLVGTTIIWKYKGFSFFISLFKGLFSIADTYALQAIASTEHVSIIVFSMLIGGMVALITLNGGMKGVVDKLSKYASTPRSGQFITWLMGLLIFFDDYANTLVVGNTMRPVTDKLKVSREKLAYLVDSTSAPIASVAFITTWIGAELSYINSGIDHLGIQQSAYQVFLNSLSYSFYPLFTLVFVLMLILKKRDFGPMHTAEKEARERSLLEEVDAKGTNIANEFEVGEAVKGRWYNAFIPVFIVVVGTIIGLVYTGWNAQLWHDSSVSVTTKLSEIIGNADSFQALLWSSMCGLIAALLLSILQKVLNLKEAIEGMINGFKTMFNAVLILVLAWSIALITEHMHTAVFITEALRFFHLTPQWVPALAFIFSAIIAFSTGSSWGTMAIIYPLILPACWKIAMEYGWDHDMALPVFYNVVSSVLAGSVLGDHCSPISDTTILSSLASSCNHLSHVRTQMPYALLVGAVSLGVGTIPAAFGITSIWLFLVGIALLYFIVNKWGKVVD